MLLDTARYHGWHGKLQSPWRGVWALVGVGMKQVFRRKAFWLLLALALLNFVLFWSVIYAITQLQPSGGFQNEGLRFFVFQRLGFQPETDASQENGYLAFIHRQSVVVMLLLAFAGSVLVGADFRQGCLPFYLSRRFDRWHYIVGKLLAISALVCAITVVPALLLFFEYGMFTSSFRYWLDNWRVAASVLGYGAVLCVSLGLPLAALSAWLQRTAPIAVAWASLFLLTAALASLLKEATGSRAWELLSPWSEMRYVARLFFDRLPNEEDRRLAWQSCGALAAWCGISLAALVCRVRSVEVVH